MKVWEETFDGVFFNVVALSVVYENEPGLIRSNVAVNEEISTGFIDNIFKKAF